MYRYPAPTLTVGQRVRHQGHGLGTITEIRAQTHYSRWPYIVQFDSGYNDFYAESDLRRVRSSNANRT